MKHKGTVLNLILILVLCLSFITPVVMPTTPVLAAEWEEEDNFTTMPNYRWKNETTTHANVTEELVGDQYIINNTNVGEGTQAFAKSRALNSRDFYFESRFALDIGGAGTPDMIEEEWLWDVDYDLLGYTSEHIRDLNATGGFLTGYMDNEVTTNLYSPSGLTIDTASAPYFTIRANCSAGSRFIFLADLGAGWKNILSAVNIGTVMQDYTLNCSDDEDWTGTCEQLYIAWQEPENGYEGDELLMIDSISIWSIGAWSTTDGFKFSLLNADGEEGMDFQFTRNLDLSYNISIDMYNLTGGIALDYDYTFDYDIDTDGWLNLRVDWHLDKRNAKITLEFDNGTDIVKIRRLTDLYGDYIGFTPLLLLEEGFPSLCMNNSIGAWARSYVIINYIDADWVVLEWRAPVGETWTFAAGSTLSQHIDANFDSISPYGVNCYHSSVSEKHKWYILSVDRFDGLSFDFNIHEENIDSNDLILFYFGSYNVHENGSLETVFTTTMGLTAGIGITNFYYKIQDNNDDYLYEEGGAPIDEFQGSISLYYDSSSKIVMQHKYDKYTEGTKDGDYSGTATARPIGEEEYTKEMVFVFGYRVETHNNAAADDIVDVTIGGFDLTRKDIIGWLVGAILGPFFQFLTFLFSPFMFIFQMLTVAIIKAFKDLLSGLEPLFNILGGIFEVAIGALQTAIGGFFDTLADAFIGAIEGIWGFLEGAIADIIGWLEEAGDLIASFIIAIFEFLFPIIADVIAAIWGFIAAFVFYWWDVLGLPDFLAILDLIVNIVFNAINAVPTILQAIIDLFLFWHLWILIGIWVLILPIQAAQCEGVSDFIERVLGVLSIDSLPFEVFGFGGWFPLAIPLIFWTCAEIIVLV